MTEQKLYRRLVRRSTHRSRSATLVVTLAVLALVTAYGGTEAVLAALGLPALLLSPMDAVAIITTPGTIALAVAATAALLGLVLVIAALTPGRRARHELPNERMAVIVDDSVLAGAIGKAVTREARVADSRVGTELTRRRGTVRVTGTSGIRLDEPALAAAATGLVASLDPRPRLRVGVEVASSGVVGS